MGLGGSLFSSKKHVVLPCNHSVILLVSPFSVIVAGLEFAEGQDILVYS